MQIEHDLFDIVWELKRIDPTYRIERREGAFWLYSGRGDEAELKLPFERLDMRTVQHVRKTRIERAEALLAEIERANAEAERAAVRAAVRQAEGAVDATVEQLAKAGEKSG